MCGFLFCSFDISDADITKSDFTVRRRGPDGKNIVRANGCTYVHYLLHITGEMTEQPIVSATGEEFLLYNGEIYNYKSLGDFKSDGQSILAAYQARAGASSSSASWINDLDGEFGGIIHAPSQDRLVIFRDAFGTKPVYMAMDSRGIAISSYLSQLSGLGFKQFLKVPINGTTDIDLNAKSGAVTPYRVFDVRQHKDSYDDWCDAFYEAVRKRTDNDRIKYFIGLSSGYDSGLIAAVLNESGTQYNSYSIKAAEDVGVMKSRAKLVAHNEFMHLTQSEYDSQQAFLIANCEPYDSPPRATRHNGYSLLKDKGAVGTGIICEKATSAGCRVYISGQGSDEIISDYGHNGLPAPGFLHATIAGKFPPDLSTVFPWENFFSGTQEEFLAKDEHVGGTYGIETRYPFLDFSVVQEFLWLSPDLKNRCYKAPIDHMLTKLNFPMARAGLMSKVGFRANSGFKR